MEFRAYWRIFKRRWLLVLIPALVVLAIGLITYDAPGRTYNAGIRFIAGQRPSSSASESDEERLANWRTSEYIVNTLATWIQSGQFAEIVSQRLASRGITVAPDDIQNGIAADDARSVMTMSVTFVDPDRVADILIAAADVLVNENARGLPQLGGEAAELVQLDLPIVNRVPASILSQLDLPFRIGLALAAGVGLAIFVEYLDPTIHEDQELELMGFRVMGAIPNSGNGVSQRNG